VSIGADDRNGAAIIPTGIAVVRECNPFSVGRDLGETDPIDAVEQHLAYGVLQTPVHRCGNETDDRHALAIRGPIGFLDVVEDLPRTTAAEWNPRKCAAAGITSEIDGLEAKREFALLGNREQGGVLDTEFLRTGLVRTNDVNLRFAAVPSSVINDAAIGREASIANVAGPKGNLLVFDRGRDGAALAQPPTRGK
jgi:hypothetical protein